MRFIGSKAKVVEAIEDLLRARGVDGGTLCDIFAGTASVARHFKRLGFRIISNDLLASSYLFQLAYVRNNRVPRFAGLLADPQVRAAAATEAFRSTVPPGPRATAGLREAIHYLNRAVPPARGLIGREYSPAGPAKRRFFRPSHARKIDGIIAFLRRMRGAGRLGEGELGLLGAALVDAADRVANTSGTYGAYHKTWQPNTERPLRLAVPEVEPGRGRHAVHREDANRLVRRIRCDVLYVDPPYNRRQYAKNYHVPDVIAECVLGADMRALRSRIYGKTGLVRWPHPPSAYCRRPGPRHRDGNAAAALRDLILSARTAHVVVSYNEEGILGRETIGEILAEFAGVRRFDFRRNWRRIRYRRYRSDADRDGRRYRVLAGKDRDEIDEWLFHARRPG